MTRYASAAKRTLLLGPVATVASILWIDRPVSTWSYAQLHRPALCVAATHLVDVLIPAALVLCLLLGLTGLFSVGSPGEATRTIVLTSVALLAAYAANEYLKWVFGRTWPETFTHNNPSWIMNHVYGFNPIHGGEGWGSFPSGHTARASAVATCLWYRVPRLKILWVVLALAVVVGLIGADYHFIGDVCGGGTLGILGALGVLACFAPAE